jgi:hypothetical protein
MSNLMIGLYHMNPFYTSGGAADEDAWGATLILVGSVALILGITNWRFGLWLKNYNVRLLNIFSGVVALFLGILLMYMKHSTN